MNRPPYFPESKITTRDELRADLEESARMVLVKRKITGARYMTQDEADRVGFFRRPLILTLDTGATLVVLCDAEGNDGGALMMTSPRGIDITFSPV